MKIKLGTLKEIIAETLEIPASKVVSLDTLSSIQNDLDERLASGEMTREEYEQEWRDVLQSVGWTEDDYAEEVDRRWDYVDSTRDVPVYGKSYGPN